MILKEIDYDEVRRVNFFYLYLYYFNFNYYSNDLNSTPYPRSAYVVFALHTI